MWSTTGRPTNTTAPIFLNMHLKVARAIHFKRKSKSKFQGSECCAISYSDTESSASMPVLAPLEVSLQMGDFQLILSNESWCNVGCPKRRRHPGSSMNRRVSQKKEVWLCKVIQSTGLSIVKQGQVGEKEKHEDQIFGTLIVWQLRQPSLERKIWVKI